MNEIKKAANRVYCARWRQKNADKLKEYQARWHEENPGKKREYQRRWRINAHARRAALTEQYGKPDPKINIRQPKRGRQKNPKVDLELLLKAKTIAGSKAALAREIGVSEGAVRSWFADRSQPHRKTVELLVAFVEADSAA